MDGSVTRQIRLECPVHGRHEAVMYMHMNTPDHSRDEHVAICMFCLQEKLEELGVQRMKIVTDSK
jgi:hypothetical protein